MMLSPSATPPRAPLPSSNTPNGRFWIGKSVSGALALSTQLRRAGSCVALSSMDMAATVRFMVLLAVLVHLREQLRRRRVRDVRCPLLVERIDVGDDALRVGPVRVFLDRNIARRFAPIHARVEAPPRLIAQMLEIAFHRTHRFDAADRPMARHDHFRA